MSQKIYIANDCSFEIRSSGHEPSYGVNVINAAYPYMLYVGDSSIELSQTQFHEFIELCQTLKDVPNTLKDGASE